MDPVPSVERCSCAPRIWSGGKEYPAKMGEGRGGEGKGGEDGDKGKEGEGLGLAASSGNPGVDGAV